MFGHPTGGVGGRIPLSAERPMWVPAVTGDMSAEPLGEMTTQTTRALDGPLPLIELRRPPQQLAIAGQLARVRSVGPAACAPR